MKIKAAKIEFTVGGVLIACHDAEIEIPDEVDSMSEKITTLKSIADEMKEISNIMADATETEPVKKPEKQKCDTKIHEVVYEFCENCRQVFTKKTKKQRFCSASCVREYARKCKQKNEPKSESKQMITGVKNDYAPFTPQP